MRNLIVNPSFEDGLNTWAWNSTAQITTAQAHTGSQCVKVNGGGEVRKDDTAEQFYTMVGETWTFSGWFLNESFSGSGGLRLQKRDRATGAWSTLASSGVPTIGAGWTLLSVSHTISDPTIDKVRARVAFAATGIIYFDDLELTTNIDSLPVASNVGDDNHDDLHDQIHQGAKLIKTLVQSIDTTTLKNTGTQTAAGIKTFSSSPLITGALSSTTMITKDYVDTAFGGKEPTISSPASPTTKYYRGDETWQTLDKTAAGLSNADNTTDTGKPVSTAMSTALGNKNATITAGTTAQYYRGDKSWQTLDKTAAGLGNLDNTSDANKPVSTDTQTALNAKLDDSNALKTSGTQTISGVKTFSSVPKLIGTSTVDYVWTATNTDGTGAWQVKGTPVTTVDWANIPDKPTTFAPTIGSTGTTAAAGNHTHTKSDIGLGNLDNTTDAGKPITTAETTALGNKVADTRTISAGTGLTGGGALSANRTLALDAGGVGVSQLATAAKKEGISYTQTLSTRATGLGQIDDGVALPYACNVVSVKYRMGTADASGTTTVELRKNGSTVSGTSGTASTSPSAVTGTWAFAAGDILTVYITAVGTTPGLRLTADIIIEKS